MVEVRDLADSVLLAAEGSTISPAQLEQYYTSAEPLLHDHLELAKRLSGFDTLEQLANQVSTRLAHDRQIGHRHTLVRRLIPEVAARSEAVLGALPPITIAVCIGAYAAGGWTAAVEGQACVFLALERMPPHVDIMVAHEIAHIAAVDRWDIVVDGFFREGFAVYTSSVVCPGHRDSDYAMIPEAEYAKYLTWIADNKDRIANDAALPLAELNDQHRFYFTTRFNQTHPNIGYVIGLLFVRFLAQQTDLKELRLRGADSRRMLQEFRGFAMAASR